MKIYKNCKNYKNNEYNRLAKEYLLKNGINVKYYGWYGMAGHCDIVKTDKGYFYFDIDTKELIKNN